MSECKAVDSLTISANTQLCSLSVKILGLMSEHTLARAIEEFELQEESAWRQSMVELLQAVWRSSMRSCCGCGPQGASLAFVSHTASRQLLSLLDGSHEHDHRRTACSCNGKPSMAIPQVRGLIPRRRRHHCYCCCSLQPVPALPLPAPSLPPPLSDPPSPPNHQAGRPPHRPPPLLPLCRLSSSHPARPSQI